MSHPGEVYEKVSLGDGSFAKFERPLTFKVPDKIKYVEHTGKTIMPTQMGDRTFSEAEEKDKTISKLIILNPEFAIKDNGHLLIKTEEGVKWNEEKLKDLDWISLQFILNMTSNKEQLLLHSPHLL